MGRPIDCTDVGYPAMLPVRKSLPAPPRSPVLAVEVRVAALGLWFAEVAAIVRADGIFLSTFEAVPEGTRVDVEIALPGGPAVAVAGVVATHPIDGTGIAIAFDTLDARARDRLDRLAPASEMRVRIS